MTIKAYSIVKTFTATMRKDREVLGERITQWLADRGDVDVVDKHVGLSSGKAFHCLTITLFCEKKATRSCL